MGIANVKRAVRLLATVSVACALMMTSEAQAKNAKTKESENSATLPETLEFINRKLAAEFAPDPEVFRGVTFKTLEAKLIHSGSCTGLKYVKTTSMSSSDRIHVDIAAFSLSDMQSDIHVANRRDGVGTLYVTTIGDRKKVIHTTQRKDTGYTVGDIVDGHIFAMHFESKDTAERVAKALTHAVKLCTGAYKPEPF